MSGERTEGVETRGGNLAMRNMTATTPTQIFLSIFYVAFFFVKGRLPLDTGNDTCYQ